MKDAIFFDRSKVGNRTELFPRCALPVLGFELECAHTDEGDPWCIVYDAERELVVLHIARIDSRYVMARASHSKPLTMASLSAAINAALDELLRTGDDRRTA